jgi:hypothetical protein
MDCETLSAPPSPFFKNTILSLTPTRTAPVDRTYACRNRVDEEYVSSDNSPLLDQHREGIR